jgi:hypothetical protein
LPQKNVTDWLQENIAKESDDSGPAGSITGTAVGPNQPNDHHTGGVFMGDACKHGLILATVAALVSGCSTWTGPRAQVEDRRVPGVDRSKTVAAKASPQKTPSAKVTEKPQREERQAAKESPGTGAIGDAVSSDDQILEMKPDRFSRSLR